MRKYCKDCRFAERVGPGWNGARCTHPNAATVREAGAASDPLNLVSGPSERDATPNEYCAVMRYDGGPEYCGRAGTLFEPKEET